MQTLGGTPEYKVILGSVSHDSGTAVNTSGLPRLLLRIPVPWVFVLAYLAGVVLQIAIFGRAHPLRSSETVRFCGTVLFLIGAIVAGWGWILFYRARTTTVPGRTSKVLVTRGPYRFTRNPMYVGLILAYLGEMAMQLQVGPILPLFFVIAYVNGTVIPLEEAKLRSVYPEEYAHYCDRVGRWIGS